VFVDHHGDMHDPEYRHFPVVVAPARPKWERGADDLDDEEEGDAFGKHTSLRVPLAYTPSYAYNYQYDPPVGSPSSFASQPLHEEAEESPFTDETEKKESMCAVKKRRRHSKQRQEALAEKEVVEPVVPPAAEYQPSEYGQHDDWTYVPPSLTPLPLADPLRTDLLAPNPSAANGKR
jgi:hypothetical protein